MEKLFPLLQTVLGGLLAVVGSFVANILLKARDQGREAREQRRRTIEEIYGLSCDTSNWVWEIHDLIIVSSMAPKTWHEPKSPDAKHSLARLRMLTSLYHDELREPVERLARAVDGFLKGWTRFQDEQTVRPEVTPSNEVFMKEVDETAKVVRRYHEALLSAAVIVARKYT